MLKHKFAQLLDLILFITGIAIVMYAWIRKFTKITWLSICITGIISFILSKIIWSISTNKFNRKNLKNQELKFAQNCINYFSISTNNAINFFSKIIPSSIKQSQFLVTDNNLYYFDYTTDNTTNNTLCKISEKLNSSKKESCYLFTSKLSEKATALISSYPKIKVVSDYDAYLLMKNYDKYPISAQKSAKISKKQWKSGLISIFARKKAKPYFAYGVLLLIVSIIMPYTFLYCIIGSLSVGLSLVCLIFNNKNTNNNFDLS